jgi:hypothetical protein
VVDAGCLIRGRSRHLRFRKDARVLPDGRWAIARWFHGLEVAVMSSFRLRSIMRQGTASSVPETWTRYQSPEEARAGAKHMYHDDRVLRIMLVVDGAGTFVEWIER